MLSINDIKTAVAPLVKDYPVRRVILFGSYARGDATNISDIDLIIDSGGQLNGFDFFGIVGTIVKTMPIKVDVFELNEIIKPSEFYNSIIKEGVTIYESQNKKAT